MGERTKVAVAKTAGNGRDTILILNFGGQYTHLIGRNVRENNVYSEIVPFGISAEKIKELSSTTNIKGIILSGGPDSVYLEGAPRFDPKILDLGIPVLGLCYGHQLIAQMSNGRVESALRKEYGDATAVIDNPVCILKGLKRKEEIWMSHGDTVFDIPADFEVLAHTESTPVAAFRHRTKQIFGLQWHPEVVQTKGGVQVIRNFIFDECKCEPNWKMDDFVDKSLKDLRERIGSGKAVVALSGGVDSSVAAALVAKAVGGQRLVVVYVDTGMMRKGETEQVRETFTALGTDLRIVDAGDRFFDALKGVRDPEMKRKIIGNTFIRIFEEQAAPIGADYFVQGTIYPDTIETAGGIKTHHNKAIPFDIKFKEIIEPLTDLYKDEVRKVGGEIGLPEAVVNRQPFPGPGLAVRIMGEVTREKVAIVREADHIVTSEIEKAGLARGLWQYFGVLTDTMTTGVKGDGRAYGYLVGFRALVSREAMTAKFAELPWDLIRKISTRITNEVPGVVRVAYDTTDKPPATVEWE